MQNIKCIVLLNDIDGAHEKRRESYSMKKMISILLSVALFLSVFPFSVFAATAATDSGYSYYISNEEATIIGCDDSITGDVVLPDTLGGYPVTQISGLWPYESSGFAGLTSIEIPDSVTSIGDYAFRYSDSLTSVKIPESVTSIGRDAFEGCTSLTSIEIPDSVTSIGDWAFDGCTSLTSIEIPDSVTSIGDGAFYQCNKLEKIFYKSDIASWCNIQFEDSSSNPLYNHGTLYINDDAVCNLVIPNTVKNIGNHAFVGFRGLTNVEILEGVTSIGDGAFEDCNSLTSIEIPDSVTKIGDYAFQGCTGLTNIEIPNGVTHIGNNVFWQCTGLSSMKIPDSVTSIGDSAFQDCSGLTKIEIPDSVTSIGDYAFRNCTGLTSIKIPNSVTSIGNDAFPSKITILCTNNSAAHTYALQHHITYELFPYIYLSTNTFHVGDEYQLTVAIDSAVDVCWYSSNPDVASISSSGNMTALSEGETLITAVISGYTEEDYVATCLVTIKPVYHVYYISAGEVQLPATQRKLSEKVLALSSYTPVRTGYRFEGWSTEPNDTTVEYQPGDTYTEDADLTLYAVWKWTPKCSACDGTGQKRVSCQECDGDGYTTVKTSRTCTRCSGKGTVKQTYTVKEEHTCPICHGELVTWSDSLQGWVPCRGCNGLGTVTVEVEKEKNVTCSTCNGLGKIYSTSTKTCSTCLGVGYKKVRCTQCGGDGICTQDSFGVSYDPNGGTGAPASQTKEKASSLTLSKDIPVKDGYIFCGWSTSVGGSVKYQPGDIYSTDQDLILVAVWQKEPEPIPGYSCGDIDNNGTINLKDVTQLQKYLAGWDVKVATEYCDVNADGKINLKDVTHLQKYLAGWEVKLGQS